MRKLKGLPQVIPILKYAYIFVYVIIYYYEIVCMEQLILLLYRSSIEGFENNIKKEILEQKRIQHNDIEPLLSKLADTTIRTPLLTVKTVDDHEALQQYSSQLDTVMYISFIIVNI